jgi:succinate dehydrogenase / fumarate reductase cytochrome b subunit
VKKPPVNLNLLKMRFPITAWVSILHRLSGIFIFLLIPALLYMLQESLSSEARFMLLQKNLDQPILRLGIWLLFSAIIYHSLAGIRHLLMDLHLGGSKQQARFSAFLVLFLTFIIMAWGIYRG